MNKRYLAGHIVAILYLLFWGAAVGFASPKSSTELPIGSAAFLMSEDTGATNDALRVFYHRPAAWTTERPVVIALHGVERDAKHCRDDWREYAEKYSLLVICPEFSERKYPGSRYYNIGNVVAGKEFSGVLRPYEEWVFPVIDRVFDESRLRSGSRSSNFILFGHSAGAQFVHRYALFINETKASCIISANAGWYTMPDQEVLFPYGIENLLTDESLAKAFARPMIVLLGEQDIETSSRELRHNAWADRQGSNRFQRGQAFFASAKAKAADLRVPFNWQMITVPWVGHSGAGMAEAAVKLIVNE